MRITLVVVMAVLIASCNNETGSTVKSGRQTLVDSLELDVNNGHNLGMAKMGKLTRYQQYTKQLLDSIGALPASAAAFKNGYGKQLDTLGHELDSADVSMNTWMEAYRYDSLKDNPELRAAYLSTEKIKVEALVGFINYSIKKGDSLLKIARPGVQ